MVKDPRLYYNEVSSDYRDKVRGADTSHKGIMANILHENRFNKVFDLLPKGKKLRILDFGCGSGEFLIAMVKAGHSGVGVDTSPNLISDAIDLAKEHNVDCQFIVGDVNSIPQGEYDVIVALSVIVFLTEVEEQKLYENTKKYLADDGVFIANYYNRLIDIGTANKYASAMHLSALQAAGIPEQRRSELGDELSEIIPLAKEAAPLQTRAMREFMPVRTKNAFHIEKELRNAGFDIQKMIFTRYHLVPPVIAEHPDNLDIYKTQIEFMEDAETAEFGPVMASNIIVRIAPAT